MAEEAKKEEVMKDEKKALTKETDLKVDKKSEIKKGKAETPKVAKKKKKVRHQIFRFML